MDTPSFGEQRVYWQGVDPAHFAWQTEGPYIAATEAALLADVEVSPGESLLEIGCGEGANLHHLAGRGARLFGVDFTPGKARFAAERTSARTACADAQHLPFCDAAFDAVLVRDLLHHVPDRFQVLAEAERVLRPGGHLTVIEPNRWNPLIAAQATAIAAERGMLASTGDRLIGELRRAGFEGVRLSRAQPMPLSRVVLHYQLGAPWLGGIAPVAWALRGVERALAGLPGSLWAYLIAHGRKPCQEP
ncbi:MAG: SAM-dependent methyltransferase [Myxococcales bacterium]|nr:SAM-dependent methyltransferase [Myxococcales bacterium]